jgi:hypothetical protein
MVLSEESLMARSAARSAAKVEALKTSRLKSARVQRCLANAASCENQAAAAMDRDIRAMFADAACRWHDLASELEWLEKESSAPPQSEQRGCAGLGNLSGVSGIYKKGVGRDSCARFP